MRPHASIRRFRARGAALLAVLASALLVAAPPVPARAADSSNIVVVEDDGSILEPADPFPLAGRRVRFTPLPDGGYSTQVEPLGIDPAAAATAWRSGQSITFPGSTASAEVALSNPVRVFDTTYRELFVHPNGAVALGRPLPTESRAQAAVGGELLRSLTAGPPVVAGLWNELLPAKAAKGAGVFVAESADRVSIAFVEVPSVRPADEPNTFRITLYSDGRIDLEYASMASLWGIAGISPGRTAERTSLVDFTTQPRGGAHEALLTWSRDLPSLNEIALGRAVYHRLPDRFQFLTAFTTQPVDGPSLVGSMPVKNLDRGIGVPIFDHGELFGAQNLEHVVVMNDLAFYDDDPTRAPRQAAYSFAPSTLAVLAHETGHRWLAEASCPVGSLASSDGHWSFFLDTGGSLLGGNHLRDNADGTFTTLDGLTGFGPLDQYLMGLRPPEEVPPFFEVEKPSEFQPPRATSGQPFDARSKPESGVSFRGTRRQITIDDVIASTGVRSPAAGKGVHAFRMAFVLVVPAGGAASDAEIEKVERLRRAFGPYFQQATSDRARMGTALPQAVAAADPADDPRLRAGEPRVLDAEVRPRGGGRVAVKLDFADFDADLTAVELSTDATPNGSPTTVDVTAPAFGSRRGALTVSLRSIAPEAHELRLTLVDRRGQRSATVARPLPGKPA